MSKTVNIESWCDGEHDRRTPATVIDRPVSIDNDDRLADLCDEHNRVIDLAKSLASNAAKGEARSSKHKPGGRSEYSKDLTCPMPGHESYVAPTRTALGSHARSKHDMTLRELDAARGVST